MVGSALVRKLSSRKSNKIITLLRNELDLLDQSAVVDFFKNEKIDQVYLAAAKVGGIYANNEYPAQFIYENLMIQSNVIHSAHLSNVQKLLFLGSSCIYPKLAEQPIKESSLLSGKLESTNEPYAIAKISGIKLCESYNRQYNRDYRSVMPTNLYGPNDNFHPKNSHVIPALIRRFHDALIKNEKEISIWGSGKPMREFLHVDDMASASIFIMDLRNEVFDKHTNPRLSHINVGAGIDISIEDLALKISKVVGWSGNINFDRTKPDGTPKKLMDSSKLRKIGWKPSISLDKGIQNTYDWYIKNYKSIRG